MRKKALAVVLFVLSFLSLAAGQPRQSKSEILRDVEFDNINMGSVLAALANENNVAIGWEADPEKPQSQNTFHLQNVMFPQILDGIVKAEPRYSWREDNGSIDLFPVNRRFDLLDARIQSLQLKDVNRALAVNRLFGLPEIQALILSKNLKPILPNPLDRTRDEKLSFDLRDVTLRQALNQIAHESGSNFWTLRRYPNGTFEIKLQCC